MPRLQVRLENKDELPPMNINVADGRTKKDLEAAAAAASAPAAAPATANPRRGPSGAIASALHTYIHCFLLQVSTLVQTRTDAYMQASARTHASTGFT